MNDNPLALSRPQMEELAAQISALLVDHWATMGEKPVGAKGDPAVLRPLFRERVPEAGRPIDEILDRLRRDVFANVLNVGHPRFFAFVPIPGTFVSAMGGALAGGFNIFNGSWLGGSAAAALELGVMDWLREACGLPEGAGGLFTSGGSMANLTALVAARHAKLRDRLEGAVAYLSTQTHSSVERGLRVIGLLPEQIVKISAGPDRRLPVAALAERIVADRAAGLRPFLVIASAGTTNTGAIDPLAEIAALCREQDLWMHVDGAYGAAAIFSERGEQALAGMELADSLSLDPHKWLFQTVDNGCVLVRDFRQLKYAFEIPPDYLQEVHRHDAEVNPCDYGIELSRPCRALKLWLTIQYFGMDAIRRAIERGFELAIHAQRSIEKLGWEVVSPAQMGIVCFHPPGGDEVQRRLVDAMLADGYAFSSSTVLDGRTVQRFCTINPATTEEDIDETLRRMAAALVRLTP